MDTITYIGDVHGSPVVLRRCLDFALSCHATAAVQVGDYHLTDLDSRRRVQGVIDDLRAIRGRLHDDFHLYVCDGNHEDFTTIDPGADEPVALSEHVTYVPRGLAVTLSGGTRIGVLGGATSLWQQPGWHPREAMTYADVDRALGMGPVDVLVTHESSSSGFRHLDLDVRLPSGDTEREAVEEVLAVTGPSLHVHGHYHQFASYTSGGVPTISLAADARRGSAVTHRVGEDTYTALAPFPVTLHLGKEAAL